MNKNEWPYVTPGIPDDNFIQGKTPLTREEVRVVILTKSRLKRNQVIYDIGAGTGTISIEASLLVAEGTVYAVEKDPEALTLLHKNKEKFGVDNLIIVEGNAAEVMEGLPAADRIIIGGSGGKLKEILELSKDKLKKGDYVTVSAVTLDTLGESQILLGQQPWESFQTVQISVTRVVEIAEYKMLRALNPIYVMSAKRGG
ncbi:precorrin-6Y C5,15-methyltransferase (decarboxylating) subunit CbiT [Candidatus Contubernalis alkaliaceticus]|uniref:precorrin-6Y C5,15-methyltransferase (decarboxylating) subunit CbiT n=1 Tax=Candidatus Contubernalis alkaliaceticus TaxID=338645 RepID=UPI001F4C366B|nr:precorrin-6Y C5,15-methyltransferase (decarboxylating) subunit CbiT [Candidatus Contubernalis alkalaceticus]UNC92499.1 precorrin-6Y C5,15-methyltransferase (decarboxylating) subunit CbiT [Candidatus Contubernalis alkalaceticus]